MSASSNASSQPTKTSSPAHPSSPPFVEANFSSPPLKESTSQKSSPKSFPPSSNTSTKAITILVFYTTSAEMRGSWNRRQTAIRSRQFITRDADRCCSRTHWCTAQLNATAWASSRGWLYASKVYSPAFNAPRSLRVPGIRTPIRLKVTRDYGHTTWL